MRVATIFTILTTAASSSALKLNRRQNNSGSEAAALNAKFATAKEGDACNGEVSCVGDRLGQCVNGEVQATDCALGTVCRALPLVNSAGTTIACTTQADADARIAAAGGASNNGGSNSTSGGDPATSTTLHSSVIAKSFNLTGQETPTPGQSESLTSTNNFINFCVGKTITDGKQLKEGSCNPCPMGDIPSFENMPSTKFLFPTNGDASIKANTAFTVKLNIQKIQTGVFTSAQVKYFAAPQQLNSQGQIIGHTHFTIETLNDGVTQTAPSDPRNFAFFKGVDDPDTGGVASAAVADGLPAGAYRICAINTAANHQPVVVPVAQHGFLEDCVYFTVAA